MNLAFADEFARIRRTFVQGLAKREAEIEQAPDRAALHAALHRLAGVAGAYGFEELGQLARSAMEATDGDGEADLPLALARLKRALQCTGDAG